MKMSTLVGGLVIFAIVGSVGYWVFTQPVNDAPVCPADAKLCPDGSYVSRTGPNCEFAECPSMGNSAGSYCPDGTWQREGPCPGEAGLADDVTVTFLETRIGQGASGLDVKIVPLEVLEDSRCPVDVQCVWAGTVKVRVRLESGMGTATEVFELGKYITTEGEIVELVGVGPAPRAGVVIQSGDYHLTFRVSKRPMQ